VSNPWWWCSGGGGTGEMLMATRKDSQLKLERKRERERERETEREGRTREVNEFLEEVPPIRPPA